MHFANQGPWRKLYKVCRFIQTQTNYCASLTIDPYSCSECINGLKCYQKHNTNFKTCDFPAVSTMNLIQLSTFSNIAKILLACRLGFRVQHPVNVVVLDFA